MSALGWLEDLDEESELGPTPRQEPKLTDLEVMLVRARDTRQALLELFMAPDAPEIHWLLDLFERPAWQRSAACRGAGPEIFFPERGTRRPDEALACCEQCSVRAECLASALEAASTVGEWGGTTGRVRRGLRRSVA